MAAVNGFTKTLTVTTVKWSKIIAGDTGPQLVSQPDKHYVGTIAKAKAKSNILKELGQDADIYINDVEVGVKRYEMDLDTFLTYAVEAPASGKPVAEAPFGDGAECEEGPSEDNG